MVATRSSLRNSSHDVEAPKPSKRGRPRKNVPKEKDQIEQDNQFLGQFQINERKKKDRVPVTLIISSSIDGKYKKKKHDDEGTVTPEVSLISASLLSPESSVESDSDQGTTMPKRKYKIDRENIKINKRIMSKDTEEVIKMFKKFDDEVLTNSDAKSRLLSLGFETRKRYITTFKHYIRFCCMKQLDNFFVTGDLMKEFYEEQFDRLTSDKPVIRLRKMDPAFSKLQEINFLVYHLHNKEIPNRQIALDYLVFKETGKAPEHRQDESKSEELILEEPKRKRSKIDPAGTTLERFQHKFDSKLGSISKLTKNQALLKLVQSMKSDFSVVVEELTSEIATANAAALSAAASKSYTQNTQTNLQRGWPTRIPPPTNEPIQIVDMNHDIYTVYEILEEWYIKPPSVETRVELWGLNWIRDEVDFDTYFEREAIIKFVTTLSNATGDDKFLVAEDCDRYIRDKLVLDEFISEIELDQESLFKRMLRFRKRRN